MTVITEQTENQQKFENLLQHTKETVVLELSQNSDASNITGAEFESIVYRHISANSVGTEFEGKFVHTEDRVFPDIVDAERYGIEVKATKKDDWSSIGNSVLESSRHLKTERIYIFFGKLGGVPNVKFRPYEDCLKGIAVTHYPRYQIDMNLIAGTSIFEKMGTNYDNIRNSNSPVKEIRKYYKSQLKEGDSLWWIDDGMDNGPTVSPIIRNLSSLELQDRSKLYAEIFVRFPEVFSSSSNKFEKVPAFLVSEYGIVSSNLRDMFSAGGRIDLNFGNEVVNVPKIIFRMLEVKEEIEKILSELSLASISEYWNTEFIDGTARSQWLEEVNHQSAHMELPVEISALYESYLTSGI